MKRRIWVVVLGIWAGCCLNGFAQQGFPYAGQPAGFDPNPRGAPPLPPTGFLPNPELSQAIARKLQESGQLSQYRINVYAQGNVVDLIGDIADENQHEIVLRLLRTVSGIGVLRDWLHIRQDGSATARQAPPAQPIIPVQAPILQPLPQTPPLVGPGPQGPKPPERIDGQLPEPTPIFQPQMGPNPTIQPPPMPPYAWPTFAPYNNVSRVAYPNAYPYEQWPFIGPFYPFPRVPLGWRSVSLTWDDGCWWFHRNPTGHDWWRIRYH